MDFEELVHTQERAWFQEAADAARVIEDIIEVAKRAPSSMNTQPWHVHVLTGEPLEELRRRNMEEMVAGARASATSATANMKACINGQGIKRSDIVREVADIPADQAIMTSVAMGYPDDSFPASAVKSDRERNSDFVRYVGFAD